MSVKFFSFVTAFVFSSMLFAQERISLSDGKVSFEIPKAFRQMTEDEINSKYPNLSPNDIRYAYGNDELTVNVMVSFSQAHLPPARLDEFGDYLQQVFKASKATLKKRERVQVGGATWIHFEIVTKAIDTNIHSDIYLTSFQGRLLGVNFNATVQQFPKYKVALAQSAKSLVIKASAASSDSSTSKQNIQNDSTKRTEEQ